MTVYRLTPVQGTQNSRRWLLSTITPKCVWVCAKDEQDARWQVSVATTSAMKQISVNAGAQSPWADDRPVTCACDGRIVVPKDSIRVGDGTLLPVYRASGSSLPAFGSGSPAQR